MFAASVCAFCIVLKNPIQCVAARLWTLSEAGLDRRQAFVILKRWVEFVVTDAASRERETEFIEQWSLSFHGDPIATVS